MLWSGSGSSYCVVLADGRLSCRNSAGQWVDRGGELRFSSISTSSEHSCALATDGRAFCWGRNDNGQLGQGFTRGFAFGGIATELVEVGGNHRWLAIEAGGHAQTCGIRTDRVPMCVGHNDMGQVGREPRVASDSILAEWGSGFHLATLRTEQFVTCGIENGNAFCSGMIPGPSSGIPSRIAAPDVFTTIAVGSQHLCGLDPTGAAHCVGLNQSGQLGTGDFAYALETRPVLGGLTFTNIYANWFTTCGVTVGRETWCWGSNDGSFGRPGLSHSKVPIKVGVGLGMRAIENACGIDALSRFVCWGPAYIGPLGAVPRTVTADGGAALH
jgi:alpha-tubulin suppressor-like RCC1 family protein